MSTDNAEASPELVWREASELTLEGRAWPEADPYCRLPNKAHGVVREAVWDLGRQSAGMCVRFVTDARKLVVRYKLREERLAWPTMAAIGSSGFDLYARETPGGRWRWAGSIAPEVAEGEAVLLEEETAEPREYALYLPLYNGASTVQLGVPKDANLEGAPPRGNATRLGFYGTSIVHGGCAMRAGMAYPAILGRRFDCTTINLGFSGNGKAEPEMAELLTEVDVDVWMIDCLPNLLADAVTERVGPLVRTLRAARPHVPIVLVENITYQNGWIRAGSRRRDSTSNAALRAVYEGLLAEGVSGLTYVTGDQLLGDDGEGTMDGTHPTDLGFMRMADVFEPVLRGLI